MPRPVLRVAGHRPGSMRARHTVRPSIRIRCQHRPGRAGQMLPVEKSRRESPGRGIHVRGNGLVIRPVSRPSGRRSGLNPQPSNHPVVPGPEPTRSSFSRSGLIMAFLLAPAPSKISCHRSDQGDISTRPDLLTAITILTPSCLDSSATNIIVYRDVWNPQVSWPSNWT